MWRVDYSIRINIEEIIRRQCGMESTLRRTWAEIDLDALAHNYHKLRERIGADVKFLGVVKADATDTVLYRYRICCRNLVRIIWRSAVLMRRSSCV